MASTRLVFINLPVADLARSMAFFRGLGFDFNLEYTDEKAACMILGESSFVMLLVKEFFQTFTSKAIADTSTTTACTIAFSVDSREEVDRLAETALSLGAKAEGRKDEGFMYYRSFYCPDGHLWEVMWMRT